MLFIDKTAFTLNPLIFESVDLYKEYVIRTKFMLIQIRKESSLVGLMSLQSIYNEWTALPYESLQFNV